MIPSISVGLRETPQNRFTFYKVVTTQPRRHRTMVRSLPLSVASEVRMSFDNQYVWAVICKNHKFHKRQNLFFGHKIPLGETDAFMPPPAWDGRIHVICDDCGQENTYESKDLVRFELTSSESFTPHPLFLEA